MGWRRQVGIWGLIVVLGAAGGLTWRWKLASRHSSVSKYPFGDHALKVNGSYVEPAVFRQEQNRCYQRWKRDSNMLRKSNEEIQDLILQEVIDRATLESYFRGKPEAKVTPKEVELYYQRYIKAKYPTEEALQAYRESVFCASDVELKRMIAFYLLKLKIVARIAKESGFEATVSEVEEEYRRQVEENRQVTVRHILVTQQQRTPEAAAKRAQEIYRLLVGGAKFPVMARKYSDDNETKKRGGLLEPMSYSQVPSQFALTVFAAQPGQILPPTNTEFGWEIVKVEKLSDYSHSRSELRSMMAVDKFWNSPAYETWLKGLKNETKVEITDQRLAAYRDFKSRNYQSAGQLYEAVYSKSQDKFYLKRALESYRLAQKWEKLTLLGRNAVRKYSDDVSFYLLAAEGLYNNHRKQVAVQLLHSAMKLSAKNKVDMELTIQTYARLGIKLDGKVVGD